MKVVLSKKFQTLIELYKSKAIIAEKLGTDETVISRLLNDKRGCSSSFIAQAKQFTGWDYEELFNEEED